MRINPERFLSRLEELSRIGRAESGGVTRLAFTPEDRAANDLVRKWMKEAGLAVRMDPAGNTFGRLDGTEGGAVVLTGSHLDTVREGGRYDGAAGVIAALETLTVLSENSVRPRRPVEMAVFRGEEGSRFPGGLMGSLTLTGKLPDDYPDRVRDGAGVSLAEAMTAFGANPAEFAAARYGEPIKAFLELHIEQAGVLEDAGRPVGIVTGIAGPHMLRLTLRGRSGHAGAMPMTGRRDPIVAAGQIIQAVEKTALAAGPTTRGTVGYIKAYPGGTNVIASEVEMTMDYRDIDVTARQKAVTAIKAEIAAVCRKRGIDYSLKTTTDVLPTPVDGEILARLRKCARREGIDALELPSGAGHDAMVMASVGPMGMIFIRSRDGLSHCSEEYSSPEDLVLGTQLLLAAVTELTND
ncbi:MAG: M20 family metallo-hydrolase [bacterium]|jgi:allantoate deiminase